MKKVNHFFVILFFIFITTNSYAISSSSYRNEAKKMDADINNNQDYKKYLEEAKNLSQNQKPNKFIEDAKLVQKLSKINEQVFNDSLNNQKLKQILPGIDLDSLNTKAPKINQLMIFISSSMPINSLKQFSIASNKANGVMVLRGLINNSFKQTVSFIRTLNNKQGTRVIIDPNAFNLFAVKKVPEIVVIIDNNNCQWGRCDHTPLFDKISGNITLEYALEEISKRGEFSTKEAARFLNYLRKGGKNDQE